MKCSKCKKNKRNKAFCYRNKATGKKSSTCDTCRRKYRKKYYEGHKVEGKLYSTHSSIRIKNRNRQYVWDYLKERSCVDCGISNPIVLEFDHKEGSKKVANVSMMMNGHSIANILAEIEKCEIRCANCHRIKTAERGSFYRDIIK